MEVENGWNRLGAVFGEVTVNYAEGKEKKREGG